MRRSPDNPSPLGLVMRTPPYAQRSARTQLDIALVAAALGVPLRLYFIGASVLQLVKQRETVTALLPTGYRGWDSLAEESLLEACAEPNWLERLNDQDMSLANILRPMSLPQMRIDWDDCARLLIL